MKRSLIWTTAGIAAVGFGVPAFAARGDSHRPATPAQVTVTVATNPTPSISVASAPVTTPSAPASLPVVSVPVPSNSVSTPNSVEDISGRCDEAEHASDPRCTGATGNSVSDDAIDDDATENSVEDARGPCDEAEHASDPRCTTQGATTRSNDSSGHGGGSDDSGHGGSGTDGSGDGGGGDDSGHGGSNDG